MKHKMDGKTVREYFQTEVRSLEEKYVQFEKLIPKTNGNGEKKKRGSDHNLKDGEYVESLLRGAIRKFLPKRLEVLTGFIACPAVKTGNNAQTRRGQKDKHTGQLDIIVYDSQNYPLLYQSGEEAIVIPEGVIAVISVKKTLSLKDVKEEIETLHKVSKCCREANDGTGIRGPFLALVSMGSSISTKIPEKSCCKKIEQFYTEKRKEGDLSFDDAIGYVGVLPQWGVFKKSPGKKGEPSSIRYVSFDQRGKNKHLGLQFLLTGILSVFYDKTRNDIGRPGYTAFPRLGKKVIHSDKIELVENRKPKKGTGSKRRRSRKTE